MQKLGVSASAISYTVVLNGYSRIADMVNAVRILQQMRLDDVLAD